MKVGIPREVKNHEYRVAITPAGVHELVRNGHDVFIEQEAGVGSSIPDEDFVSAGAGVARWGDRRVPMGSGESLARTRGIGNQRYLLTRRSVFSHEPLQGRDHLPAVPLLPARKTCNHPPLGADEVRVR